MLLTNHIVLYTCLAYAEPYQNILEHFARKCSSGDWYNRPIRLQYMSLYGHSFYSYSRIFSVRVLGVAASEAVDSVSLSSWEETNFFKNLSFFFRDDFIFFISWPEATDPVSMMSWIGDTLTLNGSKNEYISIIPLLLLSIFGSWHVLGPPPFFHVRFKLTYFWNYICREDSWH